MAGTRKHKYAQNILERYQKQYGDRGLKAEENWKNNRPLDKGNSTKNSVRLDVVDETKKIVYEYKFVQKPTGKISKQINNIKQHGPLNSEIKIINPKKPPKG